MKYKIWDGSTSLLTPIGEVLTATQVKEKYPISAISGVKMIIQDATISMGVFMEFDATIDHYTKLGVTFTSTMTDQEKLDAITTWETSQATTTTVSAEERIAAALEYQNLVSMSDTTTTTSTTSTSSNSTTTSTAS